MAGNVRPVTQSGGNMKSIPQIGYSIDEGAKMLGVGRTSIYKEIKKGHLKVIKIGNRSILTMEAIAALMKLQANPSAE
jgi:excisionase family DNA binding protein